MGLDVATGPGFTAFAVAEFCDTVIASDIADGMLEQARAIAAERGLQNVRFEAIDAHDIPYPDASLDLVTCRTAPHHFRDIGKFLSEVHRVLNRTGVFLLCDTTTSEDAQLAEWHQRVEALRDPSHVAAPAPSEWRTLIADAGFEITHSTPTQVDMTFWDWVKRSGSPDYVVKGLHLDFDNSSDAVKTEYGSPASTLTTLSSIGRSSPVEPSNPSIGITLTRSICTARTALVSIDDVLADLYLG